MQIGSDTFRKWIESNVVARLGNNMDSAEVARDLNEQRRRWEVFITHFSDEKRGVITECLRLNVSTANVKPFAYIISPPMEDIVEFAKIEPNIAANIIINRLASLNFMPAARHANNADVIDRMAILNESERAQLLRTVLSETTRLIQSEYEKDVSVIRLSLKQECDRIIAGANDFRRAAEVEIRAGTERITAAVSELDALAAVQRDSAAALSRELEDEKDRRHTAVKEAADKALLEIDRLRDAQENLTRIGPVIELWNEKIHEHEIALWLSTSAFVLGIFGTIMGMYGIGPDYARHVIEVTGDRQIVVTGLIIAPVLGIAWILRIISRFILQNLALREDARQRRAIASTFVRLIGEVGGISREERAIAIGALFRAPAGGGEGDITPPSILDFWSAKRD